MKEEAFRQRVCQFARLKGWTFQYHTYDSRRSNPGWPDNVFVHPAYGRMIYVEFKSEKGRLTQAQKEWITVLKSVGQEVAVWRPSDWELIREVLGKKQRSLLDGSVQEVEPEPEGWVFGSERNQEKS